MPATIKRAEPPGPRRALLLNISPRPSDWLWLWLVLLGLTTTVPIWLYIASVQALSLTTVDLLQCLNPSVMFILAITLFGGNIQRAQTGRIHADLVRLGRTTANQHPAIATYIRHQSPESDRQGDAMSLVE